MIGEYKRRRDWVVPALNAIEGIECAMPEGAFYVMPNMKKLLGGRVRGLTQAAVGEHALRVLDTLRVDVAFIGTNALSVRHGLSTPDSDEAAVKRAMVRAANYVVVAADSSKIGREDFVSFAPLSSVDTLITDSELAAGDKTQLTDHGVEVVVA